MTGPVDASDGSVRVALVDEPRGFAYGAVQRFLVGWREGTPLPPEDWREIEAAKRAGKPG